jgi:membrane protease YdiL (CAAX protease family)
LKPLPLLELRLTTLPVADSTVVHSLDSVQRARRGLAIYLVLVIIGSGVLEWMIFRTGDSIDKHMGLVTVLMWTPAVASLIARAVLREGIRDVSFRFGGKRGAKALVVAWIFPVAWHTPLILSGQYASSPNPMLSALLFAVATVSGGTLIGILRLHTGSIWPAVLAHAAWNSIIQGPFDHASQSPGASLWIGESGVIVATVILIITVLVARRRWGVRHWPDSQAVVQ